MKKYKYERVIRYDGKRYHVYADTLEELGRKKAEKLHALAAASARASDMTVAVWAERCIDTYKTGQADITRRKYVSRVRHCILEHIGAMRLKDVTPLHCQKVLNLQAGKSKAQINEVYNALRFLFTHAVFNGLIPRDPTLGLVKPKGTYTPRRALSSRERDVITAVARSERKYWWALLMLYCGCRPSEACECKRSDISLNSDGLPLLHIRGTKTKNADRTAPMPPDLYELVKDLPAKAFLSVYPSGGKITPDNRGRLWRGLWYKANVAAGTKTYRNHLLEPYLIPKDLTPYCLRHEYCSELARRGVDIRVAQKLMGHSTIALTANVYTHMDAREIDSVAALLNG